MSDLGSPVRTASGLNSCTEATKGGKSKSIPDSEESFRAVALAALDQQRTGLGKLARLLHDDIAQMLSAVGLQLDILRMDLEEKVPGIANRTVDIQELLDRVVKRVRDISYELSPGIVERAGLQLALDVLVGRSRKLFSGNLRLIYDSSVRVPVVVAVALERIAEEAVSNAIRHARCNQIEIIVKSTRNGLTLEVHDDGIGFDFETARRFPPGLGLLMMHYCGAKAGLETDVTRNRGPGMTVRAVMARKESGKLS
jgi:signal transduction histidine kinase